MPALENRCEALLIILKIKVEIWQLNAYVCVGGCLSQIGKWAPGSPEGLILRSWEGLCQPGGLTGTSAFISLTALW